MTHTLAYELKEPLLQINGVSKSYGNNVILRDVRVEIRNIVRPGMQQGQIVAILGPSGVGKTTLFRILAGLEDPDEGNVLVGPDLQPVMRGAVGVVDQSYRLFEHRKVLENLMIAGEQGGLSYRESIEKGKELLARFGLADKEDSYPTQLSGGQRQRVSIARQLMRSRTLLLMDEPFSGLDLIAIDNVINLIQEVVNIDEKNTIIIVTHDVTSAAKSADHIWLMGRDRDASGALIPGAYIRNPENVIDLIEKDLCWHPDIAERPAFIELVLEIKRKFKNL